jgi:hypothetical protein
MVWFIDKPEILQDELDRLAAIGAQCEVDEHAKAQGDIVVKVKYRIDSEDLDFTCIYPSAYPYFPPLISSHNFPPGRHLEPYGKTICTFADKNNDWNIAKDTLAGLLQTQVAQVYEIHKSPTVISEHEDKFEGYQASGQLVVEPRSVIFITTNTEDLPNSGNGYLQISLLKGTKLFRDSDAECFTGCFKTASDEKGKLVFEDQTEYHKRFPTRHPVRWVKLSNPLSAVDPNGILRQVTSEFPELAQPSFSQLGKVEADIIGVCFDEETSRGNIQSSWLFVVRRKWRKNKREYTNSSIVRTDYLHPDQLYARTPRLLGLADKTVTLIGLGALGSQVAFQLARAGIKKLIIIDKDHLQLGNLSRWINGLPFVGATKVQAVANILNSNFVGMKIRGYEVEIGTNERFKLQDGSVVGEYEFLQQEIISKSDLVVDCSAMLNINQYLSSLCNKQTTDFVWCSATNGAWGGIVGRSPGAYAHDVWFRFNEEHAEDVISTEPSGFVQPKGCFHPTFTGAGFDLDNVSNMASRIAVSMLQGDTYGQFEADVYIMEQWADGKPIAPTWKGFNYSND